MISAIMMTAASWALAAAPASAPTSSPADKPEFRGAWVTRFEWVSPDPERCKANITRILDSLAAANFNAAVFQIRGSAETLYPSKLESWSETIGGKDPGFDPVAFAIQEARRNHIAFHAYINAMPLLETRNSRPPADPNHLFNKHGPASSQPWVCVNREGRPARESYYYMAAGIPAVQAHVRAVILDVVRRYDVDGIHLDRIRYPGPEFSFDAISRRRFMGRGNPELLDRQDWQREQLNKFINDLAAEIRAEKPQVILSCSAWGIYNRHHLDGYAGFSSGYHDYYQDTWQWCRLGAMDILMPMIYWNIADPKPNYDELLRDFVRGVGADHLVGGQSVYSGDENIKEIRVTREAGALGTVLFSAGGAQRRGVLDRVHKELYQAQAPLPVLDRLVHPEHGTILGTVVAEDGAPLVDAVVSLGTGQSGSSRRRRSVETWTTSEDGRFAFLSVKPGRVQITATYDGVHNATSEPIEVKAGQVARVQITLRDAATLRDKPYVAILQPKDGASTTSETTHLLGRATPGTVVKVNGQAVEIFAMTGAFAKDDIPLKAGENRIEVTAAEGDRSYTRIVKITRDEASSRPAERVATGLRIVEPAEDVALIPGALLEVAIEGPPGRTGQVLLFEGKCKLPLAEAKDKDGRPSGRYSAATRVAVSAVGKKSHVKASLRAQSGSLDAESRSTIEVWDPATVRVAETTSEQTGITHGLHSVRLGGPWLAWEPAGTRFEVIGERGDMLLVRLSPTMSGWVGRSQVQMLPTGTPPPHNYFDSCSLQGEGKEDVLAIAMREPVAFAVRTETDPGNRVCIDFYNTHLAATWMSHKSTAKILGPVRMEQTDEECVRVTVPVKTKQIWGYWTSVKDGMFSLHVRHAPQLAKAPDSPLKGLTIAIEAGHGGPGNTGAMGRLGTKEETVNREAANALQDELDQRGAKVVQVRIGDESPGLGERAARAAEAGADFFVSIHANSAGTSRGLLRTSGTSTYYHGLHCQLPAELVYRKLLALGWNEFGVVGNFSYTPTRNTRVPSLLVEQAFMSNPFDEARLLDPAYQDKQAIAIAEGLEEFLNLVRE